MQPILQVTSDKSPRELVTSHFKEDLPVRGGWGYSQADACIIDKHDPIVDRSVPFDGVGIERRFVECRIYEEMIIFRPNGEKFSGISWKLLLQQLHHEGKKQFDRLVFEITAFLENDWEELKAGFEGVQGYGHPEFDWDAHMKKRQEKMIKLTREFWFEVTSFFGQGIVITDGSTGKKVLLPLGKGIKYNEEEQASLLPERAAELDVGGGDFKKLNRIKIWAKHPNQINHRIVRAFLDLEKDGDVTIHKLRQRCKDELKMGTFDNNYSQMKKDDGHSHGKVFHEAGNTVKMYPAVRREVDLWFG